MAHDEILRSGGRVVRLTEDRWAHITDGHPELAAWRHLVVSTVVEPELVRPGRRLGEEWLYGPGGPSRWLKVVVQWESDDRGSVVTAFARRRLP